MDFKSITEFLENKTILITGTTGFIAKILLEKILQIQPDMNKLYLLIRASDVQAADARLQDEVLGKELFNVLREKWGSSFDSIVSEKIRAVAGDTSDENLGLSDDQLNEMSSDIDIVINVAATTRFDERYDVALGVNTLGPKHVVNFAKACAKIQLFIHVSTGIISEKAHVIGEALNGVVGLDIHNERKIVAKTISNLKANNFREKVIRQTMKDLGSQRAKMYGWPNAYVFTKAMGEMLVGKHRGNLPVLIMRPTIMCSTLKEPFPGWVEGCRTIDSIAVMYGKGYLGLFSGNGSSIMDLALVFPCSRMGGSTFQCNLLNIEKKLKIITRLLELYKPYVFFKGIFADINTEKLQITARENGLDEDAFNFDPLRVNWKDYFFNIHLPSVVESLF
uniref:Fatty acyl-CoA reductase n=1 Tax=Chenopodium quinoa TaxID=63459 RepID=A0A803MKL2_CHEQI